MMTFEAIRSMSTEAINSRVRELTTILDYGGEGWDDAYDEYCKLNIILDERYREENQSSFDAFYEKYIKGKSWEEIDPEDWSFYSDFHKDMFGFRPKRI
jgi:hypothetical protein